MKDESESHIVIIIIWQLCNFEHSAIYFGYLFFQIPLCHHKRSALQIMQILNQEKHTFTSAAKCRNTLLPVRMNIAVACS